MSRHLYLQVRVTAASIRYRADRLHAEYEAVLAALKAIRGRMRK